MEKSLNLYEMTNDLVELVGVEEIGEMEKASIVEVIEDMIANKAESIIAVTKNFESRIEAIKTEEKRLAEYRRSEEKKLERLKEYTLSCLERGNIKKLDTNLGRISLRKKPDTVILLDENLVPDIYKTVKEVISIDKKAIKEAMKNEAVEGCKIEVGGNSLIIK